MRPTALSVRVLRQNYLSIASQASCLGDEIWGDMGEKVQLVTDIGGFLRVKRLVKRHFKGQKLSLITGDVFFF